MSAGKYKVLESYPEIPFWTLALEMNTDTLRGKENFFDLGGIPTHDIRIGSLLLYRLNYHADQTGSRSWVI